MYTPQCDILWESFGTVGDETNYEFFHSMLILYSLGIV